MHGRARVSVKEQNSDAGAKEAAKDRRRALQYAEQLAEILKHHKEKDYAKEAVEKNGALLRTNPDMYTAWNYRKSALRVLLAEADDAAKAHIFEQELLLIFEALQVNPKAYGAWYHRKWILSLMGAHAPLQREFKLLDKLLKQDERNFHGWDYRRFLVKLAAASDEQEMAFASQKIDETFSNFSAWHYRSKLLAKMHLSGAASAEGSEQASSWLEPEFELVDNALFTDPNDTSAWIYQSWLLQNTVPKPGSVLTGMWPPPGCTIPLAKPPDSSTLPAILTFSKPVTGVNKHTAPVTIRTRDHNQKVDAEWRAVGAQEAAASIWVQDIAVGSTESTEVHVHVGAGPGIRTPDGVQVVQSASSSFTVRTVIETDLEVIRLHERSQTGEGAGTEDQAGNEERKVLEDSSESVRSLPGYAASLVPKIERGGEEGGRREKLFARQLDLRRQQEELEEGKSKWILLGKARLLATVRRLSVSLPINATPDEEDNAYRDLAELDPAHAEYYWEMLEEKRLAEITADKSSLQTRLVTMSYQGLPCLQLRLSNESLRRLSSLEALLWVQHLDLSHNALRSVEGIEALQLLETLDLSDNKISHASGLAALHLLPHIRWVNLANNQLGASTVDTQAYLSRMRPRMDDSEFDGHPSVLQRVLGGLAGLTVDILDLRENRISQVEGCAAFLKSALPRTFVRL